VNRIVETLEKGTIIIRLNADVSREHELRLICNMLLNMKHSLGNQYLFDFSKVRYLSSESIEEWCRVAFAINDAGGNVTLSGLNGLPERVFDLLGIRDLFRTFANTEQALEFIHQRVPTQDHEVDTAKYAIRAWAR
jgi:anti-anti-sigma regulatory factor